MSANVRASYFALIISFISYLLGITSAYEILDSFHGSIHAGDVKFYSVESTTPLIIALYSIEGDADMYASPTNKNSKPSSDDFEYTSTSCGLDVFLLPMSKQVQRMTVGIYGHVRHDKTTYHVSVIGPTEEDIGKYQVINFYVYP